MKRCPKCNRLESDDTLGFCRTDGTLLISVTSDELGTIRLNSEPVTGDVRTTLLSPPITGEAVSQPTGETVSAPQPNTRELKKPKTVKLIAAVVILLLIVAAVSG